MTMPPMQPPTTGTPMPLPNNDPVSTQAPVPPEQAGMMVPTPPAPQPWPPQMLYGPQGLPIWWQDDPAAHLTVLNEIILDERKPFPLRKLAADRSTIYEQLAQAKADPMQPVPAEVIGVPLNRLVLPIGGSAPGGSMVPTAPSQPAVASPPGLVLDPSLATSSTGSAPGMTDHAQPLGTVGAAEQGLRQ